MGSRKDAQWYADELVASGVRAAAYHAGMRTRDRSRVHDQFLADELDVVVATSAFGMGIDKPDVRFVVHASAPESLDAYYQQIGRAGRDHQPAEITLFYRDEDLHLQRFLTASRPPRQALERISHALLERGRPVRARDLPTAGRQRTRAVNLLEQAGVLGATDKGRLKWLHRDMPVETAVRRGLEAEEEHQELIRSRIEMVRGYAETTGCRRQFLLGYFGEQLDTPCGNCDTCNAGSASEASEAAEDAQFPRNCPVWHREWGAGVVMWSESDRITVLFEKVGYKTLARSVVDDDGPLARVTEPQADIPPVSRIAEP